jgi:hypothetical protein
MVWMIYGSRWDHQSHLEMGERNSNFMAPSFEQQSSLSDALEMVPEPLEYRMNYSYNDVIVKNEFTYKEFIRIQVGHGMASTIVDCNLLSRAKSVLCEFRKLYVT